jgi:hypothetical protein
MVSANLAGIAMLAVGGLEISPPHIDLGSVPSKGMASGTFTVSNISTTTAIRSVTITPQTSREWVVNAGPNGCPPTLVPAGTPGGISSCTVTITFVNQGMLGRRELILGAAGKPDSGGEAQAAGHIEATAQ